MDDPDVEAFLQIAARIVLRRKGLAGGYSQIALVKDVEVNRDSA
jgi:hypothetical protein